MVLIQLVHRAIDLAAIDAHLRVPEAGALVVFHGTARDHSEGAPVLKLRYEAYEEMASSKLQELADEAMKRWKIARLAIVHRLGEVPTCEEAVVIGVSSAHRAEAFEACRFLIDRLKATVPIWKKEVLEKGSRWGGGS